MMAQLLKLYFFVNIEQLLDDFEQDIQNWSTL